MPQAFANSAVDSIAQRHRIRTLLAFVLVQGILYCLALNLLPMWGDEAFTLLVSAQPVSRILATVGNDIHPPLYFLLAHWWRELPLDMEPLLQLRLLSVVFAILTTIFVERRWLRDASGELRDWFLLLWTFSPCLLLFSRMARSYSMQVFLSVVAIWCAMRFSENPGARKSLLAFVASMAALLYTHYAPGIAIWTGANILLLRRIRGGAKGAFWKALFLPNALILIAYLPWIVTLAVALHRWGDKSVYSLTGNPWLEQGVKLGYWFYSFAFGESIPIWLLPVTALLALPCLWLFLAGARELRSWVLPAACAALIAYLGATRWVSYPFMGARLLFFLPLFLMAVASGIVSKRKVGLVLGVLLFGANLAGVWSYFGGRDILNIGYLAPHQKIAREIVLHSNPADTVVWVDGLNIDAGVLEYYLPPTFRVRLLETSESVAAAKAELESPGIRHVWFVRNPHDISPGHVFGKLEDEMKTRWYNHSLHPYVPFSQTHLAILHGLAALHREEWSNPPRYVYEVWEFRRPETITSDTTRHSDELSGR